MVNGVSGYHLVFELTEGPNVRADADVPGLEAHEFWQLMAAQNPLLLPEMPDGAQALAYYETEMSRILKEPVKAQFETVFETGKMSVIFQPVNLPRVAAVHFSGAKVASLEELRAATRTLVGASYSVRALRRALTENLRPVYDHRAHLAASFAFEPRRTRSLNPVTLEVVIAEGRSYRLGSVNLRVDDAEAPKVMKAAAFPVGSAARWNLISESIERAREELTRQGYLSNEITLNRKLNDATQEVELAIHLTRGKQYLTGQLILENANAKQVSIAIRRWKLAPGQPFNLPYTKTFLKEVIQGPEFSGLKGLAQEVRPNGDVVDFIIRFQ